MRILHDPLPCWTTWSSHSINLSKTNIIVGNLTLFYWWVFYKNSLTESAHQRCLILLFSVCVVGDSIYPEKTRYRLKSISSLQENSFKISFIRVYRLNLSHISVHSHYLLTCNIKQSLKTFLILSKALKM